MTRFSGLYTMLPESRFNACSSKSYLVCPPLTWAIIGDFNIVISLSEHKDGPHYYYACKARMFSNFIAINNLLGV